MYFDITVRHFNPQDVNNIYSKNKRKEKVQGPKSIYK